ncbi:MAG: A/G-specific adenine glycosylase [Desulfatitalea sp.]|nr:A/G-specific adenine glycosylase [Desulfatitalea sp.]
MQQAPILSPADRAAIRKALGAWYDTHRRDLAWRRSGDPYAIWVSEVMLQQTQVKTAEPYFHRFMQRFPDVGTLARADEQSVLKLWEGLGYYSRARHLRRAAQMVVDTWDGRLPSDWARMRQLPGVGEYIAAAVLSIAFGWPYAVVDGNVKRVLARLLCLDTPVNAAASHKIYQAAADGLLEARDPGRHNQAMMELGALVCTPQAPRCDRCPLSRFCLGFKRGTTEQFPLRAERRLVGTQHWVAGAVVKNGRLLLTRRPDAGLLAGLWEFPGGPVGNPGDMSEACMEKIRQTVGLMVGPPIQVVTVRHAYTHFKLRLTLFLCRYQGGRIRRHGPAACRWVRPHELERFPLHRAVHKALPALMDRLGDGQAA